MKFKVDSLPYYGDECIFSDRCWTYNCDIENCPSKWDKHRVCSEDNPHECEWLKEDAE